MKHQSPASCEKQTNNVAKREAEKIHVLDSNDEHLKGMTEESKFMNGNITYVDFCPLSSYELQRGLMFLKL